MDTGKGKSEVFNGWLNDVSQLSINRGSIEDQGVCLFSLLKQAPPHSENSLQP